MRYTLRISIGIGKVIALVGCLMSLFVLATFLIGGSILAQVEIQKDGEIAGGKSDSIPIQLKVGEMVQGEIIAVRNQRLSLSIADFSGKSIHYFGETSTRGGFFYAAKVDGQYYIVVTNPDSFSVGTRGYRIVYKIIPTNLAPGTGSGKPTGGKSVLPWVVAGISIIGLILLLVFIRRRKQQQKLVYFHYKPYYERYSVEQLEDEISRVMSKKNELQRRLEAFGSAAPKVVIGRREFRGLDDIDIESQMWDIKRQLEKLDGKEEDLRRVLRDKKAKQERL